MQTHARTYRRVRMHGCMHEHTHSLTCMVYVFIYIIFAWAKYENIFPCTDCRVNTSHERIASCAETQFQTRDPKSQGNYATRNISCRVSQPLGHDTPVKKQHRLAQAVCYHTPDRTASRLWAGTILHWAAYIWHWRINMIVIWRKHNNMSSGTGSINKYLLRSSFQLLHECMNDCH